MPRQCAALILVVLPAATGLAARGWAANVLAQRKATAPTLASARFSIYPKSTASGSLKATIKRAVTGIDGLGLTVEADDVSSLLTGSQETVFEALHGCLARAAAVEGHPHVSMQFTISSDVWDDLEPPERSVDADNWASATLSRVACQFNVYSLLELGSCEESVVELASQSPSFVCEKPLCTMLDGSADEVFRVLRESYELACSRSVSGKVVATATLTTNKASWKSEKQLAADRAEVEALAEERSSVGSLAETVRTAPQVMRKTTRRAKAWSAAESRRRRTTRVGTATAAAAAAAATRPNAPSSVDGTATATTPADLQALMHTRRTINDFEPVLPAGWEGAIERAVRAAVMAPNHKRTEPWRFQLLGPRRIEAICELNAQLVRESGKGEAAAEKKLKRWLAMPGWLVVTRALTEAEMQGAKGAEAGVEGAGGVEGGPGGGGAMNEPSGLPREDYAAVCCAIQNLCLSLHAEGLGTKWTSGPVNFDNRFAAAAGLPPNEEVVGTLWFGTPEKVPEPPRKRLAMEEVLRRTD